MTIFHYNTEVIVLYAISFDLLPILNGFYNLRQECVR
jgi:hypothetical protein